MQSCPSSKNVGLNSNIFRKTLSQESPVAVCMNLKIILWYFFEIDYQMHDDFSAAGTIFIDSYSKWSLKHKMIGSP